MGEFVIYETDERMFFLKRQLAGLRPLVNTHVFAPNLLLSAERFDHIRDGETLIAGRLDDGAEKLAEQKGLRVCRILADEAFQAKNARLTAEGALGIIIEHSMLSLADMRVLVIGFGRIGAALCRLLSALAVSYDVATGASRRPARAFADHVVTAESADLPVYDVIVNTAPARLFSDEKALTMRHDVVYIDLASTPAADVKMLRTLGLDADVYPALPAKCAPESAALAMKDYILEVTA